MPVEMDEMYIGLSPFVAPHPTTPAIPSKTAKVRYTPWKELVPLKGK